MVLETYRSLFIKKLSSLYSNEEATSITAIAFEFVLNMNRVEVSLSLKLELSQSQQQQLDQVLSRLLKAEPIQYIVGTTQFFGLEFQVNSNTLIPRPETEELVEWILRDIENKTQQKKVLTILDIGTGSGCIAISLAKNLPIAAVEAIDISLQALETSTSNAQNNQVNVTFFHQDILEANHLEKAYDVIVSNPPYVRMLEKSQMQLNVLQFEPEEALYVPDEDPLLFYRKIAELAVNNLKPKGTLYFEINEYLGEETVELVSLIGFSRVELRKDCFGKDRMIKAQL